MRRTDRIRHKLASELIEDMALRSETQTIAQHGLRGKPSARYIEWKHEANALAKELGIHERTMLERIITQAIRIQHKRNEYVWVNTRRKKK